MTNEKIKLGKLYIANLSFFCDLYEEDKPTIKVENSPIPIPTTKTIPPTTLRPMLIMPSFTQYFVNENQILLPVRFEKYCVIFLANKNLYSVLQSKFIVDTRLYV